MKKETQHKIEEMINRIGRDMGSTRWNGPEYVKDLLIIVESEAEKREKEVVEAIELFQKCVNAFQAQMTVETTDGSKGETFMALPQKLTNEYIEAFLKKKLLPIKEENK